MGAMVDQSSNKRPGNRRQFILIFSVLAVLAAIVNFGGRYYLLNRSMGSLTPPVPPTAKLTSATLQPPTQPLEHVHHLGPLKIRLPLPAEASQEFGCDVLAGPGFTLIYDDDPVTYDQGSFAIKLPPPDPNDPLPPGLQRFRHIANGDTFPFTDIYLSGWRRFTDILVIRAAHEMYYKIEFDRRLIIECGGRYAHVELRDASTTGNSISILTIWDSNDDAHGIIVEGDDPALRDAIYKSIVCSFELAN